MERYKLWHLHKKHDGGDGWDNGKRQPNELSSQIDELETQLIQQNQFDDDKDLFRDESGDEEETNKNNQTLIPYVPQNRCTKGCIEERQASKEGALITLTNLSHDKARWDRI